METLAFILALLNGADMKDAVAEWLEDHPEATTTVEDGAISYDKLDAGLKGNADYIGDLGVLSDDYIKGETITVTKDSQGRPSVITHQVGGNTVRTDTITYGSGTITEVRVGYGKTVTITTNLSTLATEVAIA